VIKDKKILIIGASSASGRSISPILCQDNEVYFCDMVDSYNIDIANKWFKDSSFENISVIVSQINPDMIFNFAGTFTNDYEIDYKANVLVPKLILDAVSEMQNETRVLLVGSAAEYGQIKEDDNPVSETHSLNPVSIYGMTKVFQYTMMCYYHSRFGVDVVMARPFNLLSPNMSEKLFVGRLYKQIADYKEGRINRIALGNLDNKRDYIDIEEAVKKYILIMEKGISGEVYNVGSGYSVTIRSLMNDILKENGLTDDIVDQINFDNRYDVRDVYADVRKIDELLQ